MTERLRLRELNPSDKAFVQALISDSDVRRFLGGPIPISRLEATIATHFTATEPQTEWLVDARDIQQSLGLISISPHRDEHDWELSYQFHPDTWGLGYATEAARRVLDYALADLQLDRLIAETQSANLASCRLLERIGMREAKRLHRFGAEQIIYASQAP